MPRNTSFASPGRLSPFARHVGVHLDHDTVQGPLSFFNPTRARFHLDDQAQLHPELIDDKLPHAHATQIALPAFLNWRSRDNRKGRHPLGVDASYPESTASFRAVGRGLLRMCTEYPYWDISYLIAVFFTIGSLLFVVSGLFYWLPLVAPSSQFSTEATAGDALSFVGATLFQVGAVLLVFEACNENQTGCFGWALHQVLSEEDRRVLAKVDVHSCKHHHQDMLQADSTKQRQKQQLQTDRKWTWCPSWFELRTHYFHEIGFVASVAMSVGATIFYVCGICTLPPIYNNMSKGALEGVYYLTYLVGGVFFVISSVLYVLETQPTWYTPSPHLLGWHIGVWNLIGSVGWTLAASFGYCSSSWCSYQSYLTLFWASVAFSIGSILLWYEALLKYPVEKTR
ncbi:uncharacterized protein TRUGW13939_05204 [Talaromyces rugulosus]|uniref:Uncharacterized protein n=1 Tax=Talaromyces rugulosus TaxID=121627 RepID=A0A7H8QZB8_TALRU|nr:uncharacterized protein TRUGW13939_05204 [Talaromyces rugulosus]QKX58083.1 hypothetical protein TRUGW13939_05204 [Talaromyces rugulosus]